MAPNLESWQGIYAAVVADVLDALGHRRQVLPSRLQALTSCRRLCGRVYPVTARPVDAVPDDPYRLEMQAVDSLGPGDVMVVDAGFHEEAAFWGELLSTASLARGARGVVMTTCCRDLWRIEAMDFPVFALGRTPADSKGRLDVVAHGEPVDVGGVTAARGDWILGDEDGVVVVPGALAPQVLAEARRKASGEDAMREALASGMSVEEAFRRFGIL